MIHIKHFTPPETPTSATEAETQLGDLRWVLAELAKTEARFTQQQIALDASRAKALAPLLAARDVLTARLLEWAGDAELGAQRSVSCTNGRIGRRMTPPRAVFPEGKAHTASVLRARGRTEVFAVTERLDLRKLQELPLAEQRLAGVEFAQREVAFVAVTDGPTFTADQAEGDHED